MLFLLFELGEDRYAIDVRQVVEVLPLVTIKRMPHAPPGVAGLFNYRGTPVPAIDVSQLALGRPAALRLSTRLLLVHYPCDDGSQKPLGLIVERVTKTARHDERDFVASGVRIAGAPYLGPVITDGDAVLQRVDVAALLPASIRDVLAMATEGTS
jgi:chemotaxis-related protein WspB